jgi:hypothetical protein
MRPELADCSRSGDKDKDNKNTRMSQTFLREWGGLDELLKQETSQICFRFDLCRIVPTGKNIDKQARTDYAGIRFHSLP